MTGTEHVPRTGGVLLACNHIGYVDFVYGGLAANPSGRLVRFMAKRELFDHTFARAADAVAAPHRGRPRRGRGVLPYGGRLPAQGEAVGIFPEATISRSMELKEFKTGAVRIAAAAGVPIVPVIMWGTQRMMTKDHPRDFSRGKTIALAARGAAAPHRRGPGRRDRRAADRDGGAARPHHPRLPRGRAAARLLVAAGVVRRQRAHPRGGAAAGRRGAPPTGRAQANKSTK